MVSLIGFLTLLFFSFPAQALQIQVMNIEDMVERADRIFLGHVIDSYEEKVNGKTRALVSKIQVEEKFKGDLPDVLYVRQAPYFATRRGVSQFGPFNRLESKQTFLLFLNAESRVGYSSPVGFGQGVVPVATSKSTGDGRPVSIVGGAERLFENLKTSRMRDWARDRVKLKEPKRSRQTLGELKSAIRTCLGNTR